MKFIDKYIGFNKYDCDMNYGIMRTGLFDRCCVCGEFTEWFNVEIEKPVCSEEHLHLLLPKKDKINNV